MLFVPKVSNPDISSMSRWIRSNCSFFAMGDET